MEWAAATRPRRGESVSGDRSLAVAAGADAALFAVIDGLGHGEPAAAAARCAEHVLAAAADRPLDDLLTLCHHELAATRGAAITLARIDFEAATLCWTGVGNVSAHLLGRTTGGVDTQSEVRLLGGIVGDQIPELPVPEASPIRPGHLLVMATDGVAESHTVAVDFAATADTLAAALLDGHGRESDDALVLVARHRGVAA